MKRNLFLVRLNNYENFYVIANNYAEAVAKTEKKVNIDFIFDKIITHDGSLELPTEKDLEIKAVVKLCDEIIY
jgi:hypothetical protein